MRISEIQIEYWTDTDGADFEHMDEFVESINREYFLTLTKRRSDAAGGGIYDFIIKIIENVSLLDLAESYVEDGIKIVIGYSLKPILQALRKMFKKNENKDPGVEKIILSFIDAEIILYEIYPNGIDDNYEKIMIEIFNLRRNHKPLFVKPLSVHIPIFNHRDLYNLCDFRVKLDVDEPIINFTSQDYFNFWGIKSKAKYLVYDVAKDKLEEKIFYTQKKYDKLFKNSKL